MRFAWCALMGALFTAAATSAAYADLVVTAPGVIHNGGITDVIAAFTKSTGVKVKLNSSGMGGTADSVNATGDKATDVVFLPEEPNNLMGNVALDGGIKGGYVPVGRALFGLAVRAGDPHPDISTPEKFVAVLKGAKEVMISNWNAARPGYPYTGKYLAPGKGTLVAKVIYDMLQRPEFAGVHSTASSDGEGGESLGKGHGDMALQAVCEIINHPEISLVGVVPDQFYLHIDMAVAVGAHANDEKNAKAFVAFATGPQAAPLWKAKGINPF